MNANLETLRAGEAAIADGALAVTGGAISWVGPRRAWRDKARAEHDVRGAWITPALVDCHTHLVYAGNRAQEFEQRLQGASYEAIARAGGGILSTVRATRAASEDELVQLARKRARQWLAEGVTVVEIKSGYGLDHDTELRMLHAARRLGDALTVKTTFLGAHTVPPEYRDRADDYVAFVCDEVLPAAAREGLVDAVDAFCERIAFDVAQTTKILQSAQALGLPVKLHADQLSDSGGAALAARHAALSADHLEHASEESISLMKRQGTVAVLLPGAFYPARGEAPADRRAAPPRRADRACHRPQPGDLAALLAAVGAQHGVHALPAHAAGGAGGHDAPRGARSGPGVEPRHAGSRQGGRFRSVGGGRVGRARLHHRC
jgi:imidazolonepropionase